MQRIRLNLLQFKKSDFKSIPVLVPNKDTLFRIVSFFNDNTVEIDAAIGWIVEILSALEAETIH
jgi:hypothetical protein